MCARLQPGGSFTFHQHVNDACYDQPCHCQPVSYAEVRSSSCTFIQLMSSECTDTHCSCHGLPHQKLNLPWMARTHLTKAIQR